VYLYSSEQYDSDLRLYYLRARYLNPLSGRFLSRSPEQGDVEKPESLHAYLYVESNPVNYMDPTGHPAIVEYQSQQAGSGLQSHHLIEQRAG
jgi:RHS repeat-associated protein